ncbi:hypothetical protein ACHAW6_007449 [Cyclotella cf. meneghiniana]
MKQHRQNMPSTNVKDDDDVSEDLEIKRPLERKQDVMLKFMVQQRSTCTRIKSVGALSHQAEAIIWNRWEATGVISPNWHVIDDEAPAEYNDTIRKTYPSRYTLLKYC